MNHVFNEYERARLMQAIERNNKRIFMLTQLNESIEYLVSPDIVDLERERIRQEVRGLREQNSSILNLIHARKTYKN